jgi:hypothetical protein
MAEALENGNGGALGVGFLRGHFVSSRVGKKGAYAATSR